MATNQQQVSAAQGQTNQQNTQPKAKQVVQPTNSTRERAEGVKAYIEGKYAKQKTEDREKKEAWDKLLLQMDKMKLTPQEKELIKQEVQHKQSELYRMSRAKITVRDFEPLRIIGRGAFGEVRVCKTKKNSEIVAIKKMAKTEMIYKNQVAHVRAERDILAEAKNPWIVELRYSFQDDNYLYLVMEFLQGGDLMTLLMEKDILSEELSRFIIAETILAVESVHALNYIHRDLKPDNLLIGKDGHLKLSDFGLCKHVEIKPKNTPIQTEQLRTDLNPDDPQFRQSQQRQQALLNKKYEHKKNRKLAYSTVGTPDYIAPEVFGQSGYTETVDWWSIGAILFECLVGYPPFFSDDPSITCQKILHWRKTLKIPEEANLSAEAADILKRLMTDADSRLGLNGVDEIKAHPFFRSVDWDNLRNIKAVYLPDVKSELDCSRFDKFDEEQPFYPKDEAKSRKKRTDINFVGYTYKKDVEEQKTKLVQALNESLQVDDINVQTNDSHENVGIEQSIPNANNFYMNPDPRSIQHAQMGQGGHQPTIQQLQAQQPQSRMMMNTSSTVVTKATNKPLQTTQSSKALISQQDPNSLQSLQQTKQASINIVTAQTNYQGFSQQSGTNSNKQQIQNYYQQQKQMASSHYPIKGQTTSSTKLQTSNISNGSKAISTSPQRIPGLQSQSTLSQQKYQLQQQQRQPHPDVYIKKSGMQATNQQMQQQQQPNSQQLTQQQQQMIQPMSRDQQMLIMKKIQIQNQQQMGLAQKQMQQQNMTSQGPTIKRAYTNTGQGNNATGSGSVTSSQTKSASLLRQYRND